MASSKMQKMNPRVISSLEKIERNDGYTTYVLEFDRSPINISTISKIQKLDRFTLLAFYKVTSTFLETRNKFRHRHIINGRKLFNDKSSSVATVILWLSNKSGNNTGFNFLIFFVLFRLLLF